MAIERHLKQLIGKRERERVKCEEKYQIAQMLQDPNRKNGLHGSLS